MSSVWGMAELSIRGGQSDCRESLFSACADISRIGYQRPLPAITRHWRLRLICSYPAIGTKYFSLLHCCQSPMRIIAFITKGSSVRKILDHLGESTLSPKVAPRVARHCGNWSKRIGFRQGMRPILTVAMNEIRNLT